MPPNYGVGFSNVVILDSWSAVCCSLKVIRISCCRSIAVNNSLSTYILSFTFLIASVFEFTCAFKFIGTDITFSPVVLYSDLIPPYTSYIPFSVTVIVVPSSDKVPVVSTHSPLAVSSFMILSRAARGYSGVMVKVSSTLNLSLIYGSIITVPFS
jgi:hypothetical protein